jgi:hypothetical protein
MSYRTQSPDTSPEAERVVFERYRQMSAADRLQRMLELSRMVDELARAGWRARHPELSEDEITIKLVEQRLGPELAARWLERRSRR